MSKFNMFILSNGTIGTIDPTGFFTKQGAERDRILEACGAIPAWIVHGDQSLGFQERVTKEYGYPVSQSTGGTIDPDGTYHYPEDPPLYPLISIQDGGEFCYQYEHSMVAFISFKDNKQTVYVTRMD